MKEMAKITVDSAEFLNNIAQHRLHKNRMKLPSELTTIYETDY